MELNEYGSNVVFFVSELCVLPVRIRSQRCIERSEVLHVNNKNSYIYEKKEIRVLKSRRGEDELSLLNFLIIF